MNEIEFRTKTISLLKEIRDNNKTLIRYLVVAVIIAALGNKALDILAFAINGG